MEKQQREFLLRQQLAAIRKELAGLDGEPGTEEEDYRARIEAADLPEKVREAALKEAAKLERGSDQSPEAGWIRTWLDTVLEMPVEHHDRRRLRRRRGARRAGRRPRRPGRRQGPDHRVPGRAQAPRRQGPDPGRRPAQRRGAGAGRPARGRQDLARRVGGPRHGPQVRPGRAGRRPRRGGDPRPPAHLRRRAARPHRPGDPRGGLDEPGDPAGRGGQARRRLPGRPDGRAARGAGPGAEPHVPRPLPRGRAGPVRRAVHRHGQHDRGDPRAAAGPDGADQPGRLHRGREGRSSPATTCCPGSSSGPAWTPRTSR